MSDPEPIPLAYAGPGDDAGRPGTLTAVAWLFIVFGVMSILQLIFKLLHGQFSIDTGVLGVFVGPGLLRGSRGWRTCALVLLWVGMIFAVVISFAMLASSGHVNVNFFGIPMGSAPLILGFVVGAFFFALSVWEYRVLVRGDVRRYFGLPTRGN
jgi:hypothetical protein